MSATLISPSGTVLHHRARLCTTPSEEAEEKTVRIVLRQAARRDENRQHLRHPNVRAFLQALAEASGGGVDFRHGALKGRRGDPWRFTDYSTHPGAGDDGYTTEAGLYQLTIETWLEKGGTMGLSDFSRDTQDLIAVEILRGAGALAHLQDGDIGCALAAAALRWPALPVAGAPGHAAFLAKYQAAGGGLLP